MSRERGSRTLDSNNTQNTQSKSLFQRVLDENTALARTLAIREKSSIGTTSTRQTSSSRHYAPKQEKKNEGDVVMRVGGSVARARMVNNNLDWLCTKCRNHNFARVVVRVDMLLSRGIVSSKETHSLSLYII